MDSAYIEAVDDTKISCAKSADSSGALFWENGTNYENHSSFLVRVGISTFSAIPDIYSLLPTYGVSYRFNEKSNQWRRDFAIELDINLNPNSYYALM